jgi:aspartate aminotransferase
VTIPADIQELLRPLEEFEALRRKAVRLGDRLCDLSYANPYQGAQEGAIEAIGNALHDQRLLGLQYTPFGGQTIARRRVADALRDSHDLPFAYRDIILTPGAMSALQIALRATCGHGSEVVIPAPCWLDYPVYARHVGAVPVMVPFATADAPLDIAAIAAAITRRTGAVLLSNPGNPTGISYSDAMLAALAEAVARRGRELGIAITIIADETHRDFTAPGAYVSLARHYERTLIAYSFGKYHFMQGQRLGYAAISPRHPQRADLSAELERWTRVTGIATPTALMQRALPELLGLHHDLSWLETWRGRIVRRLRAAGYMLIEPDATLFVYVRTPEGLSDADFATRLAERGVLVLTAEIFHHAGWFRLALTGSDDMLARALDILEEEAATCPA